MTSNSSLLNCDVTGFVRAASPEARFQWGKAGKDGGTGYGIYRRVLYLDRLEADHDESSLIPGHRGDRKEANECTGRTARRALYPGNPPPYEQTV